VAQCEAGAEAARGKTCMATTLVEGELTAADCARGNTYQGGAKFFEVFNTHFYRATEGEFWDPVLPELKGPLTFAFGKTGLLAFSHDGKLEQTAQGLLNWLGSSTETTVAKGPSF